MSVKIGSKEYQAQFMPKGRARKKIGTPAKFYKGLEERLKELKGFLIKVDNALKRENTLAAFGFLTQAETILDGTKDEAEKSRELLPLWEKLREEKSKLYETYRNIRLIKLEEQKKIRKDARITPPFTDISYAKLKKDRKNRIIREAQKICAKAKRVLKKAHIVITIKKDTLNTLLGETPAKLMQKAIGKWIEAKEEYEGALVDKDNLQMWLKCLSKFTEALIIISVIPEEKLSDDDIENIEQITQQTISVIEQIKKFTNSEADKPPVGPIGQGNTEPEIRTKGSSPASAKELSSLASAVSHKEVLTICGNSSRLRD